MTKYGALPSPVPPTAAERCISLVTAHRWGEPEPYAAILAESGPGELDSAVRMLAVAIEDLAQREGLDADTFLAHLGQRVAVDASTR